MAKNDDKTARLDAHDRAKGQAETTRRRLEQLGAEFEEAKKAHMDAVADVEATEQAAFSEEQAEHHKRCQDNEHAHKHAHGRHCRNITERRREREARGESIDHKMISVVTIDDATHLVVAAHGLLHGAHGFEGGKGRREASRYTMACELSVDSPHDELDHERFDQTKIADCRTCLSAMMEMAAGTRPDLRSEYLSSEEHLAHIRAKIAHENRGRSPLEHQGAQE